MVGDYTVTHSSRLPGHTDHYDVGDCPAIALEAYRPQFLSPHPARHVFASQDNRLCQSLPATPVHYDQSADCPVSHLGAPVLHCAGSAEQPLSAVYKGLVL